MVSVLQVNGIWQEDTSAVEEFNGDSPSVTVSRVDSIEEAHRNLSQGAQFDCIVCHNNADNQDGLDLLKSLRSTGNTTPFIMVTDQDDPEIAKNAMQLGAQEVIRADAISPEILKKRLATLHQNSIPPDSETSLPASLSSSLQQLSDRAAILEKKEREYDTLLNLMARGFREQVNTINEFARILDEDFEELSAEQARKHLQLIKKSSGRVKRTLDALQDYQKAQLNEIQPRAINLSVIISSILDDLASSHPGRIVRSCVASDLIIRGDEALMHMCMDYLLSLVWKSTLRKSYSEITVGCYQQQRDRIFFISNNGEAITDIDEQKLDNPFDLVDISSISDEKALTKNGTFSLSIVNRIVQRHGGELWTESSDSSSTNFLFSFSEQ